MEMRRASEFSLADLTRFWNLGFTGYIAGVPFTEQLMESWIRWGSFDLDRCLVLMDGDALAGFSMLGVRGARGWLGGFGVAPDHRGKGLAYSLAADHVARFPAWGLEHVRLEVLVQNWARKVYERAGFTIARRMSVLQGTLPEGASEAPVQQAAPLSLLAHSDRLHGAAPACWQREVAYLEQSIPAAAATGLYTGPAEAPTGFAIAAPRDTAVRIVDAAAADDASAAALVSGLGLRYPGQAYLILNEPEGTPIHRALTAAGATKLHAQYEMHWAPRAPSP